MQTFAEALTKSDRESMFETAATSTGNPEVGLQKDES